MKISRFLDIGFLSFWANIVDFYCYIWCAIIAHTTPSALISISSDDHCSAYKNSLLVLNSANANWCSLIYVTSAISVTITHRTTFEKCTTGKFLLCCYFKIGQLFYKLSGGIFQCWITAIWGSVQVYMGARLNRSTVPIGYSDLWI